MLGQTVLTGRKAGSPPVDLVLAGLASRQHSLVTIAQLRAVGLTGSAVSKRVRRGVLHREYRGVYSLARPLSREGELLAVVFAGGPGAFLGQYAAAELHGLLRYPARRIDVVSLCPRALSPPAYAHRTRAIHPLDVTERSGIPVASVPRLLVDLTELSDADELTNLIHEAAFRGSFSLLATRDAMARANGRRRLKVLEAALDAYEHGSAGTKNGNERALKRLIRAAGLPEPRSNVHVEGVEVDLVWLDRRVCVEVDGAGHGRRPTRREDELKDRLLRSCGFTVVRVGEEEIERSPDRAIARVAVALGAQASKGGV